MLIKKLRRIFYYLKRDWTEIARRQIYRLFDYPIKVEKPVLFIELNNTCNFSCRMCPIRSQKREKRFMDEVAYKKIINDASDFGIRRIRLFVLGEPLIHPKIIDYIKYAKEKKIEYVELTSNGGHLDKIDNKSLIQSGLDEIVFSVTGATQEVYEHFQASSLKNIEKNISDFLAVRDFLKSKKPRVVMQFILNSLSEKDKIAYINKWKNKVDDIYFTQLNDYFNKKEKTTLQKKPCESPFSQLVILSNGDYVPCCDDIEGSLNLGNIKNTTISNAWNSEGISKIREAQLKLTGDKYPVCKNCQAMYKLKAEKYDN